MKLQVAVFPDVSVAVQVTVVVPTGNTEPGIGLQTAVAPGQLSETVPPATLGVVKLTAVLEAAGQVTAVTAVTGAGQVIVGGCVSLTLMVKVQLAMLFEVSVTVQETVVVPTGKNEPDAGEHCGAPTFGQLSETVGGG